MSSKHILGISIQTVFYCWLKIRIGQHRMFCWTMHRIKNRNFTQFSGVKTRSNFGILRSDNGLILEQNTIDKRSTRNTHRQVPKILATAFNPHCQKQQFVYLTIVMYTCFELRECRRTPTYTFDWKRLCDKLHHFIDLLSINDYFSSFLMKFVIFLISPINN